MTETNNFNIDLEKIKNSISEKTIFYSEPFLLGKNEQNNEDYMLLKLPKSNNFYQDYECIIYNSEADAELKRESLVPLMGRNLPFIIIGIEEDSKFLLCSRKQAQEKIRASMNEDLQKGKIFEAVIIDFVLSGAYVEINGITGLLRNSNFSSDYTEVSEIYSVGDKINVKCKEISDTGRIIFETVSKFKRTEPIKFNFKPNTIVTGKVINISQFKNGTGAFVRIQRGVDVLCLLP